MSTCKLTFENGYDGFTVERFHVEEELGELFAITVEVTAKDAAIDLAPFIGRAAALSIASGYKFAHDSGRRRWSGLVREAALDYAEETGLTHYTLNIVPNLWLLSQTRDYRIFEHKSAVEVVEELLDEWKMKPTPKWLVDRGKYPKLEYIVQYGESDYDFMQRLLQPEGITYLFTESDEGSVLTLHDHIEGGEPRDTAPLKYVSNPNDSAEQEYISELQVGYDERSEAWAIADYDFRSPARQLLAFARKPEKKGTGKGKAKNKDDVDRKHEPDERQVFRYGAGHMRIEGAKAHGNTPVADDLSTTRHDLERGKALAAESLLAERADRECISFVTNAINLRPGTLFEVSHPHHQLHERKLVVRHFSCWGTKNDEWLASGVALFGDEPYAPARTVEEPRVAGVQTAIVVGPGDDEIYTDEFGRVRVWFPWDRKGKPNDKATCWLRVSQGWGGTGFGMTQLPRVGQEVLVTFEDGHPHRPIVVGRSFNAVQKTVCPLPKHSARSVWRSRSTPKSDGFNEISFEDQKGQELLFQQAQKDARLVTRQDDASTIGHDRDLLVEADREDTTVRHHTQVTEGDRAELTRAQRTLTVRRHRDMLTKGDVEQRLEARRDMLVGKERHVVVDGSRHQRLLQSSDVQISGDRRERVRGKSSLIVEEDRHDVVGKSWALKAKKIHLSSGQVVVAEAGSEVTFKVGDNFMRIDESGVTLRGKLVRINSGGTASSIGGARPVAPVAPQEAAVPMPSAPLKKVLARVKDKGAPLPDVREWPPLEKVPEIAPAPIDGDRDKKKDDRKVTWVGIELVDEDNQPVAGERYEVELPNGQKRTGSLDKDGKAKIEGIREGGMCKVTFPRLDKSIWRKA